MSEYPAIFRLRQSWQRPRVDDVAAAVEGELQALALSRTVRAGDSVAITAGSRGIANFAVMLRAAVDHLKRLGAQPFVFPAMGSHGGATADGQRAVLAGYGITEKTLGCPIRATMETEVLCRTAEGVPVHFDRHAHEADHVLICNRVKPHPVISGDIESGLTKMMLIGAGKHAGASQYHRAFEDYDFARIVNSVAGEVIMRGRVVAGLAVVENAYGETARVTAMLATEILEREKELLVLAKVLMPQLPFDRVDLLVIDEIGKNIAGSGMDRNVVGRKRHEHSAAENEFPKVKRIVVRGLSEKTNGNADGIGLSEFCHSRVVGEMDRRTTWVNSLTALRPPGAMIPMHFDTDREILDAALPTIGLTPPADARFLWIRNTSALVEVECGSAYLVGARKREDLEVLTDPRPLVFDERGDLVACDD